MSTNQQLTEAIERYVNGEMSGDELARFEQYRKENAEIDPKISEQKRFNSVLKQYGERKELEDKLNAIHSEIDVHTLVEEMTVHPAWIIQLWRNHHSKISVAASVAIFAVLTTMFFTGYFSKNNHGYEDLSARIAKVQADQSKLRQTVSAAIKGSKPGRPHLTNPGNYKGTGFALSSDGYIVTNNHVLGARFDSLYVQDADGNQYRAKLVYAEPQYDIAILKITDSDFEGLGTLPYNFKRTKPDLGEDVYTLGYPEGDSPVMDRGYVSSQNGNKGDSLQYRVSIPVNPGNSGSPLINSKGNVIGIVTGKQTDTEGASYAIKAGYLYKAIQNVPLDSLGGKLTLNNKNTLVGMNRVQQINKMQNYVFMVKVY